MTDEVQNAADLIDKWAAKLVTVAEQNGPQAAELVLTVGWAGSASIVAKGVALATGAVVLGLLTRKTATIAAEGFRDVCDDGAFAKAMGGTIAAVFAGGGAVVCAVEGFQRITDVYAWAGLWRPEIYLAAKALGL